VTADWKLRIPVRILDLKFLLINRLFSAWIKRLAAVGRFAFFFSSFAISSSTS
jgi:hypothetical protein